MQDLERPVQHSGSIIESILNHEEYFLERWSYRMAQVGYLQHTTAKRSDCILALKDFIEAMQTVWKQFAFMPDFAWLLRNKEIWAHKLVESARRHRVRGLTADMYLGCHKTFIYSLIDVVEIMNGSFENKATACQHIKFFGDALEILFLEDWETILPDLAAQQLNETNRLLVLEKCRFENILNSTSDLIFVVSDSGTILNINAAVERCAFEKARIGENIWDALSIEKLSMQEMLAEYSLTTLRELVCFEGKSIYRVLVTALSNVSLATDNYLILLTDVTPHARQREVLERLVAERTEALRQEKDLLEEMNITLRNVLQNIEKDRTQALDKINEKIHTLVLPALERVEGENDATIQNGYLTVVRDQLTRLVSDDAKVDQKFFQLTHMEARVCQFIQAGHASKDIASTLNVSIETVQTHRKNIRRKLGLYGKNLSLYAHLKTSSSM